MTEPTKSSVAILGVAIDNLTMDEVLEAVDIKIAEGGFHQIATANVDFIMKSVHDEELHEALCRCDLVLAHGMPLVWASRLLGTKLKERVTGADLVPRLAELSARRGYRSSCWELARPVRRGRRRGCERITPESALRGAIA